jgi:hypothetical protein
VFREDNISRPLIEEQILSFRIFRGQGEAGEVGTRVRYYQGSLNVKEEIPQYLDHRLGAMAVASALSLLLDLVSFSIGRRFVSNLLLDSVYESQHASTSEEDGSTPLRSWPVQQIESAKTDTVELYSIV